MLSKMASSSKLNATVYNMTTNDTSLYAQYLGSSNGDGFFYLYIVNAQSGSTNMTISASINFAAWNISQNTQIIHEVAANELFGELVGIYSAPAPSGSLTNVTILPNSVNRFACQIGAQSSVTTNASLSCFVRINYQNFKKYLSKFIEIKKLLISRPRLV
jgi:hypothetical protein